ncbi:MAG TPA: SRPBCC family protein, partial [Candidatus Deferrimicrobium sp.]|nr:SRPBCC family protein [Candidatus Deferrimicrobium sp.]
MSHVHAGQRIEAPIDHVWSLAIDPERIPDYNPYMVMRNISGPLDRVGTTMDSTMRVLHVTIESKGTIVDVEPKRLIRIRGLSPQGASEWTYRFEPQGDATQVSLDI